jgi:hypothetical protein
MTKKGKGKSPVGAANSKQQFSPRAKSLSTRAAVAAAAASNPSPPHSVIVRIESEIRSPDPESGTKTWHYVQIDNTGAILAQQSFIGITDSPWPAPGSGSLSATVSGTYPVFTIHFTGTAISAYVQAAAIALILSGPSGIPVGVLLENMAIDYDVTVSVDFSNRTGTITGAHDGYPSYMVFVNVPKVYDFPQTTNVVLGVNLGILKLLPPMDISPNATFTW